MLLPYVVISSGLRENTATFADPSDNPPLVPFAASTITAREADYLKGPQTSPYFPSTQKIQDMAIVSSPTVREVLSRKSGSSSSGLKISGFPTTKE